MRDLHAKLRDYVESTIERVDVEDVVATVSMGHVSDRDRLAASFPSGHSVRVSRRFWSCSARFRCSTGR